MLASATSTLLSTVKLVKLADTDLLKLVRVVVVYNDSLLIDLDFTVVCAGGFPSLSSTGYSLVLQQYVLIYLPVDMAM